MKHDQHHQFYKFFRNEKISAINSTLMYMENFVSAEIEQRHYYLSVWCDYFNGLRFDTYNLCLRFLMDYRR